jgi:mono/diheme cytochrome c family protein
MPESTASAGSDTTAARPTPAARTDTAPKKTARAPRPAPRKPAARPAPDTPAAAAPTAADTAQAAATPPSDANAPLRDPYHQAPLDTVSQAVYDGWKQFNLNCARCHGEDVQGTTIAPHLIVSLKPDGPINTKELFVQTVCAGRPAKGMPSWCALGMDMETINQIYEYVHGRSQGKIHPGRPAVRSG